MNLSDTETLCPPVDETRPFVEYVERERQSDAYRHEDGSITYIVYDTDSNAESPRDYGYNFATLVQRNDRCNDLDVPDDRIAEAHARWHGGRKELTERIERYIAMFRPDILHYCDYWSAGESYGWGYVSVEDWERHMLPDASPLTPEQVEKYFLGDQTWRRDHAREGFDAEVDLYGQWASGEVYGAIHVSPGTPIIVLGDHGAYVTGWDEDEDSCWGFLGYKDHREIVAQFTNSPITEEIA